MSHQLIEGKPYLAWRQLFPGLSARIVYQTYRNQCRSKAMPLSDWLMDMALAHDWNCTYDLASDMADSIRSEVDAHKDENKEMETARIARLEREETDLLIGPDPMNDDTPAMPTLELALARIAAENPDAARAASSFLHGSEDARNVWVRFRVSERERQAINDAMEQRKYRNVSEYCRAKVLA